MFGQKNTGELGSGHYRTNVSLDSIMVNDTLTLINPKNLAQQDLMFLKTGDIEIWTWLAVCKKNKRGYKQKTEFVWRPMGKFQNEQHLTITLLDKTTLLFKNISQTDGQHKYVLTARQKLE